MKIEQNLKSYIEECLDERFKIALDKDKNYPNIERPQGHFAPCNPDFIYYKGCLYMLELMGFSWRRNESGYHKIFD